MSTPANSGLEAAIRAVEQVLELLRGEAALAYPHDGKARWCVTLAFKAIDRLKLLTTGAVG